MNTATHQPALLTPDEAAYELRIGRTSVYELISSGELPSIKIKRSRRILRDDLLAYITRKRQEDQDA